MEHEILQRTNEIKELIQNEIHTIEDFNNSKDYLLHRIEEVEELVINKEVKKEEIPPQQIKEEDNSNSHNLNTLKNTLNFNYDEEGIHPITNNIVPRVEEEQQFNNNARFANNFINEEEDTPSSINNEVVHRNNNHSLIEREDDDNEDKIDNIDNIASSIQPESTTSNHTNSKENEVITSLMNNYQPIQQKNILPTNSITNNEYSKAVNYTYEPSKPSFVPYPEKAKPDSFVFSANSQPSSPQRKNRQKATRVADILMKINSNDILYNILSQIFSNSIFDELLSSDVDMELIENVEKTILEIEKLEQEETQNYNQNQINSTPQFRYGGLPNEDLYSKSFTEFNTKPTYYNIPQPKIQTKQSSPKYNSQRKLNNLNIELMKKYPKTYKTLSGYDGVSSNYHRTFKKSKTNSFNGGRTFVNYTTSASGYFDPSLQNGGQSKLSSNYKKNKRDTISPVKQYIESNRLSGYYL